MPCRAAPRGRDDRPYRRGVGIALFNRAGLVFVARRIDTEPEAWQLPQGGIDEGERPRDAALRELAEETGVREAEIVAEAPGWLRYDLPRALRDHMWNGRFRGQTLKFFAARFAGRDADIDLAASKHPEFSAWRWVPLADAPALIVPFKRTVYEAVAAAFAPLAKPGRA